MTAPPELIAHRYRVVSLVALGGMGSVWKAWDELLERPVAIKQLLAQSGLTDEEAAVAHRRVIREARITARLHHPHAVTLYDVVEHDERPCLVMQFVPSRSLSAVLREEGTLDLAVVAGIGADVAAALAAAHQSGVVHRDIKPGNVLITDDGSAKLTDFGISHITGDMSLTPTGVVAGTPAYFAPEIARGGRSSFPADVFSLGATLYAAAEGTPPFGTDENPIVLLHRVASGIVVPPARTGPLTPLLQGMLATEPENRPTAVDVSRQLAGLAAELSANRARAERTTQRILPPVVRPPVAPPVDSPTEPTPSQRVGSVDPPPRAESALATPQSPHAEASTRRWPVAALVAAVLAILVAGIVWIATIAGGASGGQAAQAPAAETTPPSRTAASPAVAETATSAPRSQTAPVTSSAGSVEQSAPLSLPASPAEQPAESRVDGTTQTPSAAAQTTPPPSAGASAAASGEPTSAELAGFVSDYYALLPGGTDQGWERLTAEFQNGPIAQSREYYETFWSGVDSVTVTDVTSDAPLSAEATVTYSFANGEVAVERTAYDLVLDEGVLKIDNSTVLSSTAP